MIDLDTESESILENYPSDRRRSALLPLLHLVQERDGFVTNEGMSQVAKLLDLTDAEVASVASFYSMYHLKPKGKHVVSICHNLACTLNGAERLIEGLERGLGIDCGETTSDGEFTLERAECLAACDLAPMVQIDYDAVHGPLNADEALNMIAGLREAVPVPDLQTEEAPVEEAEPNEQQDFVAEEEGSLSESESESNEQQEPQQSEESNEGDEPAPLIESIELSSFEQRLLEEGFSRRGAPRQPSAPERLLNEPVLPTGVGPGPADPEDLGAPAQKEGKKQPRSRGAE